MKALNLVVIFLLELAVLAAVGLWGFTARPALAWRLLLGLGGPAVMIALWWFFGAPGATHQLHGPARAAFELAWFGTGAAALTAAGFTTWALTFCAVFAVSKTLAIIWQQ
ncbi:YrdB family protein [Nonomuraea sp. NBC_01738]|uniref:YrdB family protein n=1 Tax=Nonomuraea sp. NBC_01738 TaxID=2976003 RepID=UPI002E14ADF1|nr:YrdB family protein [Nonomuraea sp. NBC_01738]